jgi:hypothetical protein
MESVEWKSIVTQRNEFVAVLTVYGHGFNSSYYGNVSTVNFPHNYYKIIGLLCKDSSVIANGEPWENSYCENACFRDMMELHEAASLYCRDHPANHKFHLYNRTEKGTWDHFGFI